MAGYSGTPLPQKLGVREGARAALAGAPAGFEKALAPWPKGATLERDPRAGAFDVIVWFPRDATALRARFGAHAKRLVENGGLWIAWPKKASGVATDLHESLVREIGLAAGLVDNKVCAVDDVHSGLRFVIRLKDRERASASGRSRAGDGVGRRRRRDARSVMRRIGRGRAYGAIDSSGTSING